MNTPAPNYKIIQDAADRMSLFSAGATQQQWRLDADNAIITEHKHTVLPACAPGDLQGRLDAEYIVLMQPRIGFAIANLLTARAETHKNNECDYCDNGMESRCPTLHLAREILAVEIYAPKQD